MIFYAMQAAVETQRKYKHVLWYSLFVAAYLIVLYLQASAYNSGEVVSTLRNALMPCEHFSTEGARLLIAANLFRAHHHTMLLVR